MKQLTYIFLGMSLLLSSTLCAQAPVDYPLDTINGKIYYRYVVERGIGLYRISKNFGVSQEDILKANPDIQTNGLRFDEVILIPAKSLAATEPTIPSAQIAARPAQVEPKSIVATEKKIRTPRIFPKRKEKIQDQAIIDTANNSVIADTLLPPLRLAIMLPLQADAIKRERNIERFYDFYCGALIAINEIQTTGQHIEAFVYDVGKTAQEVERLLNDSLFPKVDAIIGPVYSSQVKAATQYALADSTWLLVPFISTIEDITTNPYILQFNPSKTTEADTLARYLAQYGDSINCVLVESKEGEVIPASIAALHQALVQYNIPTDTVSIRELLNDSIENAFRPDMENIVIFNTEKYGNLHAILPHLLTASQTYHLTLFSQYSWQNEKIVLPQLYTTVFTTDNETPETYTSVFEEYFGHTIASTQPRYDLLGYDLTMHLLQLLQNDSLNQDTTEVHNGVQSDIEYHRLEAGGYENQMIHIIRK